MTQWARNSEMEVDDDDEVFDMSHVSYWANNRPATLSVPKKRLKQNRLGLPGRTPKPFSSPKPPVHRPTKSMKQASLFGTTPKTGDELREEAEAAEGARKARDEISAGKQYEAFLNSVWSGDNLAELDLGAHVTRERLEAVDRAVARGGLVAGDSAFEHKEDIKECGAKWSGEKRAWCAHSRLSLLKLYESSKWKPRLEPPLDDLDVPWFVEQVRKLEAHTVALAQSTAARLTVPVAGESLEEKLERDSLLAARNRKELSIPDDEELNLLKLDALGVPRIASMIADPCTCLGPHAGISNVLRLLRGFNLRLVDAEVVATISRLLIDGQVAEDEARARIMAHAKQLWKQGPTLR